MMTRTRGAQKYTWIVLTDKEPPLKTWAAAKDRAEARRLWCEKEKAAFVAVKLDAEGKVDLYFLCPANGAVNTEMLSTWNGLECVVVQLETKDGNRLKGTLRGGEGSCPGENEEEQVYCAQQDDYTLMRQSCDDGSGNSIDRFLSLAPHQLQRSLSERELERFAEICRWSLEEASSNPYYWTEGLAEASQKNLALDFTRSDYLLHSLRPLGAL